MNDFDNADYYDCSDSAEELQHASPDECVGEYLHGLIDDNGDVVAEISKFAPLTVEAYRRDPISPTWARGKAAYLVDQLLEEIAEDEESFRPATPITEENRQELIQGFAETIGQVMTEIENFNCSKVATRTYQADELVALMREHMPDWFEEMLDRGQMARDAEQDALEDGFHDDTEKNSEVSS